MQQIRDLCIIGATCVTIFLVILGTIVVIDVIKNWRDK